MIQQSYSCAYIHRKTWFERVHATPMFTVILFTITKIWKKPKCQSKDEWIKKMCYIYKTDYYSVIKRSNIGSFVET